MATYYLDTSALVKRYIAETGSRWVRGTLDPSVGHVLYTSHLARVELIAAFARRVRGGSLAAEELQGLVSTVHRHWQFEYRLLEVTETVLDRAVAVAERHALRGYDAVHLAAALQLGRTAQTHGWSPPTFVSADDEQLAAAAAEGLTTLNPATTT